MFIIVILDRVSHRPKNSFRFTTITDQGRREQASYNPLFSPILQALHLVKPWPPPRALSESRAEPSMEALKEQILVTVTLPDVQRWSLSVRPVILIDAACAAYHNKAI